MGIGNAKLKATLTFLVTFCQTIHNRKYIEIDTAVLDLSFLTNQFMG